MGLQGLFNGKWFVAILMLILIYSVISFQGGIFKEFSDENYIITIKHDGQWYGSIFSGIKIENINGVGDKTFSVSGWPVIAVISKQGGYNKLVVEVWNDGKLLVEGSTSEEYGSVNLLAGP